MRNLLLAAAALVTAAAPAYAAPCKDAKTGKFIKCPEKAKVCRKDGKFAKCGTPGAK